jgi:MFS transporter, FSR family, fosmidomycin resistance protein
MRGFLRLSPMGKNLLILSSLHLIVDFFGGVWPIYKTICGMDIAKAGLIAGVTGFLGEGLQIFFGFFCDRGFRKHVLIFGFLLTSSVLLITCFHGYLFYFFILLTFRIGSGAFHPAGYGYTGALTKKHRSKAILLFTSGGLLGWACSQMIFAKTLETFNGNPLILILPVIALCAALFYNPLPEITITQKTPFKKIFTQFNNERKTLSLLFLVQVSSYSLVLSLIFLLPDVLAAKTTDPWLKMGGGHFCYILSGALVLPLVGTLCQRFNQKKIMIGALIFSVILFYFLALTPTLTGAQGVLLLSLLGASLNSVSPMILSWGVQIAPNSPSSISAILLGFAWSVSNFGPFCAGVLYKAFKMNSEIKTLSCLGILLIIAIAIAWITPAEELTTQPEESIS